MTNSQTNVFFCYAQNYRTNSSCTNSGHLLLELTDKLYGTLSSSEMVQCVTELVAAPLSSLIKLAFSVTPSTLEGSRQWQELFESAQHVWSTICNRFLLYSAWDNTSETLATMSPLLVGIHTVCIYV